MAADTLTTEEQAFLAECEEELKDRFTDKDEDFMSVFNAEPSKPPVIDSWWGPNNDRRRNDRRNNRRNHPYDRERYGNNRDRDHHDRRDHRGYNDYNRGPDDRGHGNRQRHRYHY